MLLTIWFSILASQFSYFIHELLVLLLISQKKCFFLKIVFLVLNPSVDSLEITINPYIREESELVYNLVSSNKGKICIV